MGYPLKIIEKNTKFGKWTTTGDRKRDGRMWVWQVVCECGTEKWMTGANLRLSHDGSGCRECRTYGDAQRKYYANHPFIQIADLTGVKFGSWLVISLNQDRTNGASYWNCRCDCGNLGVVSGCSLRSGKSTRCKPCANKNNSRIQDNDGMALAYERAKRSAAKRGIEFLLTFEEWSDLSLDVCFYCNRPPERPAVRRRVNQDQVKWINGIDRWDNKLGYCVQNCVTSCLRDNLEKTDHHGDDYCKSFLEKAAAHS
jgi:hypothetical protein